MYIFTQVLYIYIYACLPNRKEYKKTSKKTLLQQEVSWVPKCIRIIRFLTNHLRCMTIVVSRAELLHEQGSVFLCTFPFLVSLFTLANFQTIIYALVLGWLGSVFTRNIVNDWSTTCGTFILVICDNTADHVLHQCINAERNLDKIVCIYV